MTTETKLNQRPRNFLLAWLILANGSVIRMAELSRLNLLEKVSDILTAGVVLALTGVVFVYVFLTSGHEIAAVTLLGVGFGWYAALDQLNTRPIATVGQMLFFSIFVPVVVVGVALGIPPVGLVTLAVTHFQVPFWGSIALLAAWMMARYLIRGGYRVGWAAFKRWRHDSSPDVDPIEDGVQTGSDDL